MKVNLERGGIIWQARLHMGTATHTEPLDKDAGEFRGFGREMTQARLGKGVTPDEVADAYSKLEQESVFNPIGRVARAETDLPTGKRLNVNLVLLNESVGVMPPYRGNPDIRKIGRANFFLQNINDHAHGAKQPRYTSKLNAGYDILTDGSVNLTSASSEACNECITVLLHDESKIISRLGLHALYENRDPLPSISSPLGPFFARIASIHNQKLNDEQVSGLQGFLAEQFQHDKN